MFFSHMSYKVSGGVVLRLFLFGEPFTVNTVGNLGKDAMQTQRLDVSETAAIIVP